MTAVFCAGDLLAMGAMRAFQDADRRIPADLSVVSIDDIDLAAYVSPPLTTISQSLAQMATAGVQLLFDLLAGKEPVEQRIVIEPQLIVRRSTAKPPA